MSSQDKFIEFRLMIEQVLNGSLPDDQIDKFNNCIINDAELRGYYCEYINLTISIQRQCINLPDSIHSVCDHSNEIFQDLLKLEQDAPAVECEDDETIEEPVVKNTVVREYKPNRFIKIYNKLVTIAAVLLITFILYANLFPPEYSVAVGHVVDEMGIQWAISSERLDTDDILLTNQAPYVFEKGYLKLRYDEGVSVVIEGPASFEIDKSKIFLDYGKLYAHVYDTGKGFTVQSSKTKMVDLGTEFGVVADNAGSIELHVLNGQVQFYSGLEGEDVESQKVFQENALRFDSDKGSVTHIPIDRIGFVRDCNSSLGVIWGGHPLDLADVVGGGNGFGTGLESRGVDFHSGDIIKVVSEDKNFRITDYVKANHPYIDGVFMPDGRLGQVQVSSTGLTFGNFPDTNGDCYVPVCNNYAITKGFVDNPDLGYLILADEDISNLPPRICLHSNAGITFDLAAIRSAMPGFKIHNFSANFGMLESNLDIPTDVDLCILVDGKEVYSHPGYLSTDDMLDINIKLEESDRFLTVTCMEGKVNYGDWAILINPILQLSNVE